MKTIRLLVACAILIGVLAPVDALAQQTTRPVRRGTPVRKPVIDLEKEARKRRPGQVMPGDPAPGVSAPRADAAPEPARPQGPARPADDATDRPAPVDIPASEAGAPRGPRIAEMAAADAPRQPARSGSGPDAAQPGAADRLAPMLQTWMSIGDPLAVSASATWGAPGGAQWRDGAPGAEPAWRIIENGQGLIGRVEVRTGAASGVAVEVDRAVVLSVDPLTKLRVRGGEGNEVVIEIERGGVVIRPAAADELGFSLRPVRVITPHREWIGRSASRVEVGALTGTVQAPVR